MKFPEDFGPFARAGFLTAGQNRPIAVAHFPSSSLDLGHLGRLGRPRRYLRPARCGPSLSIERRGSSHLNLDRTDVKLARLQLGGDILEQNENPSRVSLLTD